MSELKVDKVSPRTGTYVSLNTVGSKNIVINGDMSIAQRSTSVASITTTGYYTVDRFKFVNSLGTFTMSQDTDVPTGQGLATSLKLDCTTADASPAGADNLRIQQIFEGQNLQYLKKGTSSAESLTLSFWVKSTKTGTFIAELYDLDNNRQISKSYTVSVTNTWEKKTITFAGDTTGAFTNDNTDALSINFWLGAGTDYTSGTLSTTWTSATTANRAVGQVNVADNTANNFWITGVQLEAGTTASDFEFLPYDMNLARCQRYFQRYGFDNISFEFFGVGTMTSTTNGNVILHYKFIMRTPPTATYGTASSFWILINGVSNSACSAIATDVSGTHSIGINATASGTSTAGTGTRLIRNSSSANAFIKLDSEL